MDKSFLLKKTFLYDNKMPIAKIINTTNQNIITENDDYVYITNEKYDNKIDYSNNKINSFIKFLNNKNIHISTRDLEKVKDYLIYGNDRLINNELKDLLIEYELNKDKDLYLNDYKFKFQPIPYINNETPRLFYFVAGASGSGKSFYIKNILEQYNFYFKKSPIYLISEKKNDENYKHIKNMEIIDKEEILDLNEKIAPYEYFISETGQSLVLFDDVEIYKKDKNISESFNKIVDSIATVGRSVGISAIYVNHGLINVSQSNISQLIFESTRIVIFPNHTIKSQIKYFLKKRLLFEDDLINRILKINTRSCTIDVLNKCIISDYEIFFF